MTLAMTCIDSIIIPFVQSGNSMKLGYDIWKYIIDNIYDDNLEYIIL